MRIEIIEPIANPFSELTQKHADQLSGYLAFSTPTDEKGRYLHYHELRHRIPSELDSRLVWSIVKQARSRQAMPLVRLGGPPSYGHFVLTPTIQKAVSETDRNTTTASLEWMSNKIGEGARMDYLLKDLIEDESISSSQLEGAATTTKVAKRLLKRNGKPRNEDEKMILGNFKMMMFAWKTRKKTLSFDLICEMHKVGVEGIDDDSYLPGNFRKDDNVHVVDNKEGEIIYTPPPAKGLKTRLERIIDWINTDHDNIGSKSYLHPLIKAIVLHFVIGYEHPFSDGNGRVARALFYWFLFKNDFAAFRYIAISVLLKKAPAQYVRSYLYTETDGLDLTYFIEHQCNIVIRAIKKFKDIYKKAALEIESFNQWLWESGLYKKLTDKQRTVFQVAKGDTHVLFTIRNVEKNLGCSYNTAAAVLNGLVELNLFEKRKHGREWVYSMKKKDLIIDEWEK